MTNTSPKSELFPFHLGDYPYETEEMDKLGYCNRDFLHNLAKRGGRAMGQHGPISGGVGGRNFDTILALHPSATLFRLSTVYSKIIASPLDHAVPLPPSVIKGIMNACWSPEETSRHNLLNLLKDRSPRRTPFFLHLRPEIAYSKWALTDLAALGVSRATFYARGRGEPYNSGFTARAEIETVDQEYLAIILKMRNYMSSSGFLDGLPERIAVYQTKQGIQIGRPDDLTQKKAEISPRPPTPVNQFTGYTWGGSEGPLMGE